MLVQERPRQQGKRDVTWKQDCAAGTAFIDGAMVANNPVMYAVSEVTKLWPNRGIACVHSLGTGTHVDTASTSGSVMGWASALVGPPNTDEHMWRQAVSTVRHIEAIRNDQHPGANLPPASMIRMTPPGMAHTFPAFHYDETMFARMRKETVGFMDLPGTHLMFLQMAEDLGLGIKCPLTPKSFGRRL